MARLILTLMLALSVSTGSYAQGKSGLKGKPEDNPAETRKYLQSLAWGDDYATDQIVETVYTWGNNSAMIRIVPMTSSNMVSWQSALGMGAEPGDGYFVAKIYNLEDKSIGPLGLGKLGTGYLWVGAIKDGRGAAIYSIRNNGTIEGNPKKLPLGGFCAGQHPDARVELTDGKKCPGPFAPIRSASTNSTFMFASFKQMIFAGGGLWVSCLGGCCEVQIPN
jgi:hypothetical protein